MYDQLTVAIPGIAASITTIRSHVDIPLLPYTPAKLRRTEDAELLTQCHAAAAYRIGHLATRSAEPLPLRLDVNQDAVLLLHVYAGELSLHLEQRPLIAIGEHRILACALAAHQSRAITAAPGTGLLVVAMDRHWYAQAGNRLPLCHALFDRLADGALLADALPALPPDADTTFLLNRIRTCDTPIDTLLSGKLENYAFKLLGHYEQVLQAQYPHALGLWWYVHDHYTDFEALHEGPIQRYSWMNLKTANRHYQKAFGCTLQQHAHYLRMGRGYRMLSNGSHSVIATAYTLGYKAPEVFGRAFLQFFGVKPSEIQRRGGGNTDN